MRRRGISRESIEAMHGRNCVADLPSGGPVQRFTSPKGEPIVVLRNPGPEALRRLTARDGYASIRVWLSPEGNDALAWTAGDVTHFQLFGDLEYSGWHQVRIDPSRGDTPVVSVQEPALAAVLGGRSMERFAGGRFLIHTNLRTIESDGPEADEIAGREPGPAPGP